MEEYKTVDTVWEENKGSKKRKVIFPTGRGESTKPEKIEALYAHVRSWGAKEENDIHFPEWRVVNQYRDPIGPTSISSNFAAVFTEVASLLNSLMKRTVILHDITQYSNKVPGRQEQKICQVS